MNDNLVPEQRDDTFWFRDGKQSFIGQFGYYDDDEGGVIDGKGLAAIDPLKGPRYGTRPYSIKTIDPPYHPNNISEFDPSDTSVIPPATAPVQTNTLDIYHPAEHDGLEWVEEIQDKRSNSGKKVTTNLSRAKYEELRRQAFAQNKNTRDRRRYVDTGGPFLGPGAHNKIQQQLKDAGRVPITNQVRGKFLSQTQTRVPNGQVYGEGAGTSSYGGGGGSRSSNTISKEQQTLTQSALFEVYPKEEFPLYGRFPPHYGRFLIKKCTPPSVAEIARARPTAFAGTSIQYNQAITQDSFHNHNHGFPFIAPHTNLRR